MRKFNRRTPVKTRKEPYLPFLFLKKAPVFPNFFFFQNYPLLPIKQGSSFPSSESEDWSKCTASGNGVCVFKFNPHG